MSQPLATPQPPTPLYRARPEDLSLVNASPFCSQHEYRTALPLSLILEGRQFFAPVVNNLRPGDEVGLVRFHDRNWLRVTEVAVTRVVAASVKEKWVELRLIGEIEIIPLAADAPPPPRQPERYVQGNGTVKWNVGTKQYDVIVAGQPIFATADKTHAEAIANGSVPIPPPSLPQPPAAA